MSCEGCLTTKKGQDEQLQITLEAAKKYAVENNQSIAIYFDGQEYQFINAEYAISHNYNIKQVVSKYN